MTVRLHTMYEAERGLTLPSNTNDGGEIAVPYLTWSPGSTLHPCEAQIPLALPPADGREWSSGDREPCGRPAAAEIHQQLEDGSHHTYLMSAPQPGMYLTLDKRLGFTVPPSLSADEAERLIEFLANAIAIGAGYPSIYFTKRKMPFRG